MSASRSFLIAVQPLTQQEIDAELALMAAVRAHYFDGIRNANTDAKNILTDLHPFQEAYLDADGQLVWVYDHADLTGSGIVPVAMASGTTILGMLPLLFDSMFGAMAATIMGGLLVATLLTVCVLPVVYALFYNIRKP